MSENKTSPVIWIAGGCGLLSLFGCCIGGAVGIYLYQKQQEEALVAMYGGDPSTTDPFGLGGSATSDAAGPAPMPLVIPQAPMPSATSVTVMGTVDRVAGTLPVTVGSQCVFVVEVTARSDLPAGYWCHTVASCNGLLLYGGATNGYFPCAVYDSPRAIIGEDAETTASDGDGSFQLDTRAGRLIVRDDAGSVNGFGAFRVEASIQTVL